MAEYVYLVTAIGYGSPDRICDTIDAAKALCADYLACLSSDHPIVEDWTDISANRDGSLWVRYFRDPLWVNGRLASEVREQRIDRRHLNTTGKWFAPDGVAADA